MPEFLLLLSAGLLAGVMNALAGGGSFISFPALMACGLPAVTANTTNAIALWPASITAAWAARQQLRSISLTRLKTLCVLALCGGLVGAGLLLIGSEDLFRPLVPWLLLLATGLFALSPWLAKHLATPASKPKQTRLGHFLVSVYGGYFGAGMGILQLAAHSLEGYPAQQANALKNLLSALIYSIASVTFLLAGAFDWPSLLWLLIGTSSGGYLGARLADYLPDWLMRSLVILIGSSMTLYYFIYP